MPLDPQALLACQAAMHCVPPRENLTYARAAIQLQEDRSTDALKEDEDSGMPRIRPMGFKDIPRVVRTVFGALDESHDPMRRYLVDTSDFKPTRLTYLITYLSNFVMYTLWVVLGLGWVIDGGDSFIIAQLNPPNEQTHLSPLVKWFSDFFWKMNGPFGFIFTQEQRNRQTEIHTTQSTSTHLALGARIKDMLKISTLATHPSAQRKGYASALIRRVTEEADRQNRATYLYSSNHFASLGFYHSLGFKTVGTYEVGKENEGWEGEPVVVGIMVREPRKAVYSDAKAASLV
ncbi:hypothetical protein BDY19DRAFT_126626 [Irpex rosettiformis]|uniref:Uncharacterized protein n=1 Tax=Irpex rosettiformis TaxID=378272 RepID=A0ACB8U4A1_9APHY|nr:hypothetical protein BDY19DRAFT_126626 [Irpex rosettiformis]